jgi:hypothetical protein
MTIRKLIVREDGIPQHYNVNEQTTSTSAGAPELWSANDSTSGVILTAAVFAAPSQALRFDAPPPVSFVANESSEPKVLKPEMIRQRARVREHGDRLLEVMGKSPGKFVAINGENVEISADIAKELRIPKRSQIRTAENAISLTAEQFLEYAASHRVRRTKLGFY